jgi:hypothetical protein
LAHRLGTVLTARSAGAIRAPVASGLRIETICTSGSTVRPPEPPRPLISDTASSTTAAATSRTLRRR